MRSFACLEITGPTVISGVKPEHKASQAEIFGPVLQVVCVGTLDEAIDLINRNPYGKQAIQFYTQVKTVTTRWFDDAQTSPGIHTTISLK